MVLELFNNFYIQRNHWKGFVPHCRLGFNINNFGLPVRLSLACVISDEPLVPTNHPLPTRQCPNSTPACIYFVSFCIQLLTNPPLTAGQGETPHLHPTPTHIHFDATEGVQPSPLAFRRNREVPHFSLPISTQRRGYYPLRLCFDVPGRILHPPHSFSMRRRGCYPLPLAFRRNREGPAPSPSHFDTTEGTTLSACVLTRQGGYCTLPVPF